MAKYQPKYTELKKYFFLASIQPTRASSNGLEYLTAPIKINSEFNLIGLCDTEEKTDSLSSVKVTKLHFAISSTRDGRDLNTTGVFNIEPVELFNDDEDSTLSENSKMFEIPFDHTNFVLHSQNDINWNKVCGSVSLELRSRIGKTTGDTWIGGVILETLSNVLGLTITITGYELQVETINYNRQPRIEEPVLAQVVTTPAVSEVKFLDIKVVGFINNDSRLIIDKLKTMLKNDLVTISGLNTGFQITQREGRFIRTPLYAQSISLQVRESDLFHIDALMELWLKSYDAIVKYGICFYIVERNKQNLEEFLNIWTITNPFPSEFSGRDVDDQQDAPVCSIALGGIVDHTKYASNEVISLFKTMEE